MRARGGLWHIDCTIFGRTAEAGCHGGHRGRAIRVRFRSGPGRSRHHRHAAGLSRARWIWCCTRQRCFAVASYDCADPVLTRRGTIIHTREGHRPDLADLPPAKKSRGRPAAGIGDPGPMGRILVRGEPGHDIIPELYPLLGEPVVDKPGKGAFYATDLDTMLKNRGIAQLIVCGVTTEVCVNTTVREANERGYDCLVPSDCVGSYFPEFQAMGLKMIKAQGGIFGWVSTSEKLLAVLHTAAR